jgi:hypothetical protein
MSLYPVPAGAEVIERARRAGKRPDGAVIVSYVGPTPWDAHHVHCESGKRYRWGWSEELQLAIVVEPGVDAMDAIRGCFWPTNPHHLTTIIDIKQRMVSYVLDLLPSPKLWPLRDVSGYFPEGSA